MARKVRGENSSNGVYTLDSRIGQSGNSPNHRSRLRAARVTDANADLNPLPTLFVFTRLPLLYHFAHAPLDETLDQRDATRSPYLLLYGLQNYPTLPSLGVRGMASEWKHSARGRKGPTPLVHRSGLNSPLGSHSHWAIVLYESIVLQRKGPATTRIRRPTS